MFSFLLFCCLFLFLYICVAIHVVASIWSERVGGQTYIKKGVYYVLVLTNQNLATFEQLSRQNSGRCLRGMFIPLCALSPTGECAGLLYTKRRGLLCCSFTAVGFARTLISEWVAYTDSHPFFIYAFVLIYYRWTVRFWGIYRSLCLWRYEKVCSLLDVYPFLECWICTDYKSVGFHATAIQSGCG